MLNVPNEAFRSLKTNADTNFLDRLESRQFTENKVLSRLKAANQLNLNWLSGFDSAWNKSRDESVLEVA